MDPTLNVAKQFPDTIFMHASGFKTHDNMGNYFTNAPSSISSGNGRWHDDQD